MFQGLKLTDAGKALYYENLAGKKLTFTQIKMGDGQITGPISTMTDLVHTVVSISAAVTATGAQYATVSGQFSNAGLTSGFYWREIGITVADPDNPDDRSKDILYAAQNAYDTADFIPAAAVETVEKSVRIPIIVGDAEQISCSLLPSQIFVTQQDLTDHDKDYYKKAETDVIVLDAISLVDKDDTNKKHKMAFSVENGHLALTLTERT